MNKLMFAAAGIAVAGSAFSAPLVYDYKASVKHMYLKEIKLNSTIGGVKYNTTVYQKYQKSASLKGYLIMDEDAATSATYGGKCDNSGTYSADQGRNRGFLVVQNSSAESKVRMPKILPAVLDAKWIDTNFKKGHAATSGLAEGTLFVGGDTIGAIRPKIEKPAGTHAENATALTAPAAGIPGLVAYSDYVWTSIYLFGQFNGPNWFKDPTTNLSPFDAFEAAWDGNLPTGLQTDWANKPYVNYFHDTWMNGAGIGKYTVPSQTTGELCCGLTTVTTSQVILDTLSGNVKGGLFLCTENGIDALSPTYNWFDGQDWEDQFACCRDNNQALTYAADSWQNDLWQDGAVEQETTDVIYGTWSIKYNKKFLTSTALYKELTDAEKGLIFQDPTTVPVAKLALWACIKGAGDNLAKKTYIFFDQAEIYNLSSGTRFATPMITPKFATYYGLAD